MKSLVRLLAIFAVAWGTVFGLSHFVRLGSDWPLWAIAVGIALAAEAVILLYRYEGRAVAPGRARLLLGLRLASLVVLVWILLEPTWVRTVKKEHDREVVVIFDDSASMHLQDDGEESTRLEIGERVLAEAELTRKLSEEMRVRTVRAARSVQSADGESEAGWRQSTDLAAALANVLEQVPPDELGGVVLVSDGRHNRPARVEDVARRFGILDAPIGVLAMGSTTPPKDASILRVEAPEAIHLGDRMRVKAELKFDGYKGQKAKVRLLRGGEVLDQQEISIPQDHHREEVRFAQIPEAGGVGDFRIEIAELEGERFSENNAWDFETSITDARTNVLLIDQHPRWEFRYLRNLFYGRDKSVHLQWVLLNPDRIAGEDPELVAASAARPFGDAQATSLPANEEEWRKFDVIILGDLSPESLDEATWDVISRCVEERAAMLVMVAGPEHMPHAIASESGRSMVPVELAWGARTYYNRNEPGFHVGVTSEGASHPITQQATDGASNDEVWAGFPEMRWRHPVESLKEGAEALLVAEDPDRNEISEATGLTSALSQLAERRQSEAENALLVVRQTGRGKVALLLTDRTWRLREGSGDVYHHRFWGNLMRWGAGPVLRAGGKRARLGTDQLTYTPDDPIKIQARLREEDLSPLSEDGLLAEIVRDGTVVASVSLAAVEDSNGLHEGLAGPFGDAGLYEVRLKGGRSAELMAEDGNPDASAGFRVVGSRGPVELADTTLNLPLLQTLADLSGGKVVETSEANTLAGLFLGERHEREEIRETSFWDHWLVLGLLAVLLTSEWVLRRGGGLP